jgi:hypothetical protein
MEMSVGTMVTIVLLMIVLVLGIFFIQKIFSSGTNAIETIDSQVQSELQKLFASEGAKLAFYPTSRDVIIKKGDDVPRGFAFQVRNNDVEQAVFSYTTTATDASKCGSTFNEDDANDMLLGGSGNLPPLSGGDISEGQVVKFVVPESAPPCTIAYQLEISKDSDAYSGLNFFLTIK